LITGIDADGDVLSLIALECLGRAAPRRLKGVLVYSHDAVKIISIHDHLQRLRRRSDFSIFGESAVQSTMTKAILGNPIAIEWKKETIIAAAKRINGNFITRIVRRG
jgi:hypothetical protein